jgi:hypothetical protein
LKRHHAFNEFPCNASTCMLRVPLEGREKQEMGKEERQTCLGPGRGGWRRPSKGASAALPSPGFCSVQRDCEGGQLFALYRGFRCNCAHRNNHFQAKLA